MLKAIYLTRRHPRFTQDQYVKRWRQHGALAMSKTFSRHQMGYAQCEPILPTPIEGGSEDYHGVAYIFSRESTATSLETEERRQMVVDEYATFAGPIIPVVQRVDETVLKPGPMGGVTAFLFFEDPAKAASVAERYQASAAERVILNVRNNDLTAGDMASLMPYRAVAEVSACNIDRLKSILEPGEAAAWRGAEVAMITRECVLWDRLAQA